MSAAVRGNGDEGKKPVDGDADSAAMMTGGGWSGVGLVGLGWLAGEMWPVDGE